MEQVFNFVWLIPLFPLAAFVLIAFGARRNKDLSSYLVIGAMALSMILSLVILFGVITYPGGTEKLIEEPHVVNFASLLGFPGWMPQGAGAPLNIGFRVDPLAAVMLFVVSVVGLNIFVYSRGYMHGDPRFSRFFAFLALFATAMLMLVIANDMLLLFISWELVGLCSYFLIGFWFEKKSAADAGMKAFITTRIGDVGLYLGLLMLFVLTGHIDFAGIFHGMEEVLHTNQLLVTVAALLVFCGAVGKSAQFPLHVWLPDAMEGPTPVSALIHAATMVAAGVYLVARMFPLFSLGLEHGHGMTDAMWWVACIGAFTALFASTIAVAQDDIKRVLAYSTISQLGYMIMGLGVGAMVAAVFHLMTHAFFKALLFLGSGSVIHGCGGEQDMIKMGGLRKKMPITFWTFVIGTLALAGIFPFAGFWSKDEILHHAMTTYMPVYLMGAAGAFLTAFYMTRQVGLTFFGELRDHKIHAHESPPVMWVPLAILAFFAAVLGLVGFPLDLLGGEHFHLFGQFLDPHAEAHGDVVFMLISTVIAVAGIALGWFVYIRRPLQAGETDPLVRWLGPVHKLLRNKYYFDELYQLVFIDRTIDLTKALRWFDVNVIDWTVNAVGRATGAVSRGLRWVDINIVDGLVNALGDLTAYTGDVLRVLQTGKVQNYALIALTGLLFLAGYFIYFLYR